MRRGEQVSETPPLSISVFGSERASNMHRPLNRKRQIKLQSLWPAVLCFASVARCEATIADVPSYVDSQHEVLGRPPLQRLGGDAHVAEGQRQRRNHHGYKHPSTSKSRRVYAIRGGQQGYHDGEQTAFDNEYDRMRTSTKEPIGNLAASRNMKKFSSASSSTTDDVAEAVRTRGEGIAADLNLKQEPTQDETLRDHSSAAFGDPGGHTSYDPATAVSSTPFLRCTIEHSKEHEGRSNLLIDDKGVVRPFNLSAPLTEYVSRSASHVPANQTG